MDQEQKELRDALTTLMEARDRSAEDGLCAPFVSSSKEFGLQCGASQSALFALHHLLDVLGNGTLFVGERRPNTTLEAMQYMFPEGDIGIYDNVVACRTPAAITLTIRTRMEHSKVMAALTAGAETAQQKERNRQAYALRERKRLVALFDKEAANPVFGKERDEEFVRRYLVAKTDGYFGVEAKAEVGGPIRVLISP